MGELRGRVQAVVGSGVRVAAARRQLEFALLAPRVAVDLAESSLSHCRSSSRKNWTGQLLGRQHAAARPAAAAVVAVVVAVAISTTINGSSFSAPSCSTCTPAWIARPLIVVPTVREARFEA